MSSQALRAPVRLSRGVALERWAPPLALAAGLAWLMLFDVFGVGRLGLWAMDFHVFHSAGQTWLAGESPYDRSSFDRHYLRGKHELDLPAFASPPASAPLYMGLALMTESGAMKLLNVLNLAAVILLGWITARMALEPISPGLVPASPNVLWYFPALFAFSTFAGTTMWFGQVSLITAAALQAAWYLDRKRRPVAGGMCLALAGLKPQLLLLPLLWFLLQRRWRMILVAGVVTGLLMAYPLAHGGPIEEMKAWVAALQDYRTHEPNRLAYCSVVGLPSVVVAVGGPAIDLTVAAMVLTGILWWFRRRICVDDVPALLIMGTLGLVYGHDLDFVYLAPLAVSLVLHLRSRPGAGALVVALLALSFIPSRFVCQFGLPLLDQWRTGICLVFLGWVLGMSARHAARCSPAPVD